MLLSDKYPFLTNYFTTALSSNMRALPQSILFYGNDLEAQYVLAKEVARFLNCKEDKSDDCECLNCRWIRENSHPAIMTISKLDNKPQDDDSKTVISIKQSQMIKETLMNSSEFHRVFIFCDKNENGEIMGLNPLNFQAETSNSLLKIIEEPQPGVTFIFLTRYIDDILSTIISRSQCFFVPSKKEVKYEYTDIEGIFTDYWNLDRKDSFDISQNLQDLTKDIPAEKILEEIQNYMLTVLKSNPHRTEIISQIKYVEDAITQIKLGIKPLNVFDSLCLNIL